MASSQRVEIRHPEMISVGKTTAQWYLSTSNDPEFAKDQVREVSLMLMESIEPVEVTVAH